MSLLATRIVAVADAVLVQISSTCLVQPENAPHRALLGLLHMQMINFAAISHDDSHEELIRALINAFSVCIRVGATFPQADYRQSNPMPKQILGRLDPGSLSKLSPHPVAFRLRGVRLVWVSQTPLCPQLQGRAGGTWRAA